VHPVVVGSGRRLFEDGDHFDLTLADTQTYENVVISVNYTSAPRPDAE
jgi:dihydrofolate reductase